MKKIKLILAVVSLISASLLISDVSFAQGCCSKSSNARSNNPNKYASYGGTVKQVGKYNIEMVFEPMLKQDPLTFYLMNKKGKVLSNQGITGKVEFAYTDGSTETVALETKSENGFSAQMKDKSKSFVALITLQTNGENIMTKFDSGSSGNANIIAKSIYTCLMHPEVKSDKPGNCPKCGMTLEKQ